MPHLSDHPASCSRGGKIEFSGMHPIFLTFQNSALEKRYAEHRIRAFFNRSFTVPFLWFIVRSVIIRMVFQDIPAGGRFVGVLLFWLLPLFQVRLRRAPLAWLQKNLTVLHLCEGFLQPALALTMIFDSNKILLASGMLTHWVNIAWYCLPFKLYLIINAWTICLFLTFMMPHFCTPHDLPVPSQEIKVIGNFFTSIFDGPPFCRGSKCYEPCSLPCHRLFFVWHIFMYGVTFPLSVWISERTARFRFRSRELNEDTEVYVSAVGVERIVPKLLYALPLIWWSASVIL